MDALPKLYTAEKAAHTKAIAHSTLRQRQKKLARDEILAAALKLFEEQGYKNTTMQAIADAAGVGVATVFRQFGKKNAILAACVKEDLESVFSQSWDIVLNPGNNLTDTINALLQTFLSLLEQPSKKANIPNQYWPSIMVGEPAIDETIAWADTYSRMLIYGAFLEYQEHHQNSLPFNITDMAEAIFYVFNGHYLSFISNESYPQQELVSDIKRRVALILLPYT